MIDSTSLLFPTLHVSTIYFPASESAFQTREEVSPDTKIRPSDCCRGWNRLTFMVQVGEYAPGRADLCKMWEMFEPLRRVAVGPTTVLCLLEWK